MSSSRDPNPSQVVPARFDLDFRGAVLPAAVLAEATATGHSQGYAAGWAEGRRAAADAAQDRAERAGVTARQEAAELGDRIGRALASVVVAAGVLEQRVALTSTEIGDLVLAATLRLTEELVGHELAVAVEPGPAALRRVLALAPSGGPVQVRMHPADQALLTADLPAHREIGGRTVTLLADPTLMPGDAVAECGATTIDARIERALERVREVLSGRSNG